MCKKLFFIVLCLLLIIPFNVFGMVDNISAEYAVAIDKATNTLLYEKNKDTPVPIASTTKIMTCLIACEICNFDDEVVINQEMLDNSEGTSLYLKVGDKISVEDLVKGALLSSGNDAANALAIFISGSIDSFASLMNEYASKFEMKNTNFATPSGLDAENHYSSAYDMSILTSNALDNELFSSICSLQNAEIYINDEQKTITNHNKLLFSSEECIGVKTGYTSKAGRCLVSAFNYKDNVIIIVTLNACDDWNDHHKLLEYSQKRYRTISEEYDLDLDVVGGTKEVVDCKCTYDVSYIKDIKIYVYYFPFVYAPIEKGDSIGIIKIYSNNKLMRTVEIIAQERVELWQITK